MHGPQTHFRDIEARSGHVAARQERRHGGRIATAGSAVIHAESCSVWAHIVELSTCGVRVVMDSTSSPPFDAGSDVRLELRLDRSARWFSLFGCVERIDARANGTALAITLFGVPPDLEDLVQDALLAALEVTRRPSITCTRRRDHRYRVDRS
jgi:hypothetical protein